MYLDEEELEARITFRIRQKLKTIWREARFVAMAIGLLASVCLLVIIGIAVANRIGCYIIGW